MNSGTPNKRTPKSKPLGNLRQVETNDQEIRPEMNETIEADVDAKGTECQCCGETLESKESSRMCVKCQAAGCRTDSSACIRNMGGD